MKLPLIMDEDDTLEFNYHHKDETYRVVISSGFYDNLDIKVYNSVGVEKDTAMLELEKYW